MTMIFVLGVLMVVLAVLVVGMALGEAKPAQGVGRSIAALEAMANAPAEMRAELDKPFGDRVLQPLQKRALALGRRLTGADSAERVRRKLDLAGNPRDWSIDRVISLKVIGAVALAIVGPALALLTGMSGLPLISRLCSPVWCWGSSSRTSTSTSGPTIAPNGCSVDSRTRST